MCGESFTQRVHPVRLRPKVFSQLAEQANQITLRQNLHRPLADNTQARQICVKNNIKAKF